MTPRVSARDRGRSPGLAGRRRGGVGRLVCLIGLPCLLPTAAAGQMLETETARLLPPTAAAVPVTIEYGVARRVELLVEPVVHTLIRPNHGPGASGIGDLEGTLLYLVRRESAGGPGLALAGEIKLPTARNRLIGTGATDFTGYLIGSKRLGRLDLHVNASYAVLGRPPGTDLANVWAAALALEYHLAPRLELFVESLANTGAASDAEGGAEPTATFPAVPEAPASQLAVTFGSGLYLAPKLLLSLALSYDTHGALLLRPACTLRAR